MSKEHRFVCLTFIVQARNSVFFMHLEAVSEAILESKTGAFHETLGFNNFGKSTELLLCGLLNERDMQARKNL